MEQQSSGIPLIEIYWPLVDKADNKFSKIKDLPIYERSRFDTYFYKVFKVYTELWKFQQENRQKLVEGGLKRREIGEIASRIAQLYFGLYMRTSEASYLSESYVFYEAILTREYFEGLYQDINLATKQLSFLARFITVCLLLNRRHMVHQLASHLKILLDECKRIFQFIYFKEANFREWKLVVQEIVKFLKADTNFLNIRPLRYSLVLDPHPDALLHIFSHNPKRNLKLRDAVLSSYHPFVTFVQVLCICSVKVKYSELTLDTYRMLQNLEWEPSGAFYHSGGGAGQNGIKSTHFIVVLATACNDLLLMVFSSSIWKSGPIFSSTSGAGGRLGPEGNVKSLQSHSALNTSPLTDGQSHLSGPGKEVFSNSHLDCIHIGSHRSEGSYFIYPSDLLPFTRRPLFIVIDSESSGSFKVISGSEKGEPAAMLLSPRSSPPTSSGERSWNLMVACLQSFSQLPSRLSACCWDFLGLISKWWDVYEQGDKLLSTSLNDWGLNLATSGFLDPVWSQVFCDPFLRRLLLRFIFYRAVLTLHAPTHKKVEYLPSLPEYVHPASPALQSTILQIAKVFDATSSFIFSEDMVPHESSHISQE